MKPTPTAGRRGFTLIEMIITLCVFLLLAGAVFNIFNATLQGVAGLQDDQDQADQTEALHAWLAASFLAVPEGGLFVSYRRENSPFDVSNLVWQSGRQLEALDLSLQPNGHYTLRLAVASPALDATDFERAVLQDDPSLAWRPLVHDIVAADWRFRGRSDQDWEQAAPGGRELLVQFTYQVAGTRRAVVDDCWIPPLAPAHDFSSLVAANAVSTPAVASTVHP